MTDKPKRRPDWMARLHNSIENAKIIPFGYGTHDCCLWAAHCVDAMCDTKIAQGVVERFNYHDETSANAVIDAGGGLHKLIEEFLGPPVSATLAAPGDVVIARVEDVAIVGIVVGHNIVAPQLGSGLTTIPYSSGVLCWKV